MIDFDWVTIPARSNFLMGSDKANDKLAYDDETPRHTVFLPEYRIARIPVTVAQFAAFMADQPRTTARPPKELGWVWNWPLDARRSSRPGIGSAHASAFAAHAMRAPARLADVLDKLERSTP